MGSKIRPFKNYMKKTLLFSVLGISELFKTAASSEDKSVYKINNASVGIEAGFRSSINFGIDTKSLIESKNKGLIFDAGSENSIDLNFIFSKLNEENRYNRLDTNVQFSLFKGSYILGLNNSSALVGASEGHNISALAYFLDNYMSIDSASLKWGIDFSGGKHKLDVKIGYGADEYSNNQENKTVFIAAEYTHSGVFAGDYELKDIKAGLGINFSSDSAVIINKLKSKLNDVKYEFSGPTIFTACNTLQAGLNFSIPFVTVQSGFTSKYVDISVKSVIDPLHALFYDNNAASYMRWGVLVSATGKIVDEQSKNVTLNIGVGRDELLSYWFIDEFVGLFESHEDCICIDYNGNDKFYLLPRPLLFNFNATGMYDFASLVKPYADFIKELSLSLSFKYECIFDIKIQNYTSTVSDLKFFNKDKEKSLFTDMFYINIGLTPTIKFEDEISDNRFSFLRGSEFTVLGSEFTLKPVLDVSSNHSCTGDDENDDYLNFDGSKVTGSLPSIKYTGFAFSFGITVGDIKYKFEKQGLEMGLKLCQLNFEGGKLDWHGIFNFALKFDIFKFINNRN